MAVRPSAQQKAKRGRPMARSPGWAPIMSARPANAQLAASRPRRSPALRQGREPEPRASPCAQLRRSRRVHVVGLIDPDAVERLGLRPRVVPARDVFRYLDRTAFEGIAKSATARGRDANAVAR